MTSRVTIITSTYNKAEFLREAAASVMAQSHTDWRWWLILDGADDATRQLADRLSADDERIDLFDEPTTSDQRREEYRPAVIINEYYPRVTTPYMCWLSDDDLWESEYLSALTSALDDDPDRDVVYGRCHVVLQEPNRWRHVRWLPDVGPLPIGLGTDRMPVGVLDGGQVLHTSRAHAALNGFQLPTDFKNAGCVDGLYLNQLAERFTFWPVDQDIMTKRQTYLSTHKKGRR